MNSPALTRRDFLEHTKFGIGGIALASLLAGVNAGSVSRSGTFWLHPAPPRERTVVRTTERKSKGDTFMGTGLPG